MEFKNSAKTKRSIQLNDNLLYLLAPFCSTFIKLANSNFILTCD